MKKILLILSLVLSGMTFAQTGWVWQNPKPFGGMYNQGIYFLNQSTGWIAQGNGSLLKTTNAGNNWNVISINPQSYYEQFFYQSYFFDELTGYITGSAGNDGIILKTSDGGLTCHKTLFPFKPNVRCIDFLNNSTGFAGANDSLYKTTNSGLNWISRSYFPGTIFNMKFVNDSVGFLSTFSPALYKTTNKGDTWFMVFSSAKNFFFVDQNTGWASSESGSGNILKTTDGGINWVGSLTGFSGLINFTNSLTGYVTAERQIRKTTNGGDSWTASTLNVNDVTTGIYFLNNNTGIITSAQKNIYKTTNGAASWDSLFTSYTYDYLTDVFFTDNLNGFIAGYYGAFLKTSNGGETWDTSRIVNGNITELYKLCFINNNTGFIAGRSFIPTGTPIVYKTTNAGVNWSSKSFTGTILNDVFFIDSQTGWLTGDNIYKTTNQGENWQMLLPNNFERYGNILFLNTETGWVINNATQFLMKSSNGGINWVNQIRFTTISDAPFAFPNSQTGYIYSNGIQKTTNGGGTWFSSGNFSNYEVNNINFLNSETGYCSDFTGRIHKTTNGGGNWNELQKVNNFSRVSSIYFTSENTGWAIGGNGAILKTTTGGNVFVEQISSVHPEYFYLKQNYPNPFNPITVIGFQLPVAGFISLKVFDINGREVSELVNGNLNAGEYKINFNGSALPSGVYYYKLTSDNFSETKKMILIK